MKTKLLSKVALITCFLAVSCLALYAWEELAIVDDPWVFMPGSQPGSAALESANRCDNCHGGYNIGVEPAHTWRGSMMANAARDPLWMACLTVSLQDSIWAMGNTNAGDLCIRCHTPTGWLGGRSDPPTTAALAGSDFEGVSCDYCHTAIDPFAELGQPEVPADSGTAGAEADTTQARDLNVLSTIRMFDGTTPFLAGDGLPTYYGTGVEAGALPNYIEATSGQYFVDAGAKRGPRSDPQARHQWYYSRFHKSKYMCATCHDVSNPVLARLLTDLDPEQNAAASFMHVERTFSEFMLSAYGRAGGASTSIPGVATASKCQDCHMRDVVGKSCNKKGVQSRTDLALHDLTGGNVWMSKILASADQTGPVYDSANYNILAGITYSGAKVDVSGIQGYGQAILDGAERARQQLEMAATLEDHSSVGVGDIKLRIVNNTGHKLLSGFPEGRRMWLNVKFYGSSGLIGEINPYSETTGILSVTDENLVYEAKMSSKDLTLEDKTFHFVLATERYKDNRIPPKGFDIGAAAARLALPRWGGAVAPDYFDTDEYAGGYDEVTIPKPGTAGSWEATLYYQTTSKEYIEFLRDEINGDVKTLEEPGPSGENAYLAQTDPYFVSLKDWGDAIHDLWTRNDKCPPIEMASLEGGEPSNGGGTDPPCPEVPNAPTGLTAAAGRRDISLDWTESTGADGYNVYYFQNEKYTFLDSTSGASYTHSGLDQGQTFTYAVTAYVTCPDGSELESSYSNKAGATIPFKGKGGKK